MKRMNVGDLVIFKKKVYAAPYYPFYERYRGCTYEIVAFHYEDDEHVELELAIPGSDPTYPDNRVYGFVHRDELKVVKRC